MSKGGDKHKNEKRSSDNHEVAHFGRLWDDHFEMDLMRPMGMDFMKDPFNDMVKFSDTHKGLH